MNRYKILALLAAVALLALLPAGIFAQQPEAPHRFFGTATLASASLAPDGTVVAAMVGGNPVATTQVESSFQAGFYLLDISPPIGESYVGQMVTFLVDGVSTGDSVAWQTRGSLELNLTGTAAMTEGDAGLAIGLFEENNSGQSGRATLAEIGDNLQVVLSLNSGALWSELTHIHSGQCNESGGDTLGGAVHTLTSFVGGSGGSTTMLAGLTLAMMQDGNHAINVRMAGNAGTYTACGNIPPAGQDQPRPVLMKAAVEVDGEALTEDVKSALISDAVFTGLLEGKAGTNGLDGEDGEDGEDGRDGRDGADGTPGLAGPRGLAGANGLSGANGRDGRDGADGDAGRTGPRGEKGDEGDGGGGLLNTLAPFLAIAALFLAFVALVGARVASNSGSGSGRRY